METTSATRHRARSAAGIATCGTRDRKRRSWNGPAPASAEIFQKNERSRCELITLFGFNQPAGGEARAAVAEARVKQIGAENAALKLALKHFSGLLSDLIASNRQKAADEAAQFETMLQRVKALSADAAPVSLAGVQLTEEFLNGLSESSDD